MARSWASSATRRAARRAELQCPDDMLDVVDVRGEPARGDSLRGRGDARGAMRT